MKLLSIFLSLLMVSLICINFLQAEECYKTYSTALYIGPEIYYAKRVKEGGAKQGGVLYGIRAGYDYIKRYSVYWGVDGLWARGNLKGEIENNQIRSIFTDANIEGRFGYTLQHKTWCCASLTPFVGVGYFWETNKYHRPNTMRVHFKNEFAYIPVGFLSQIFINPNFSIGLNFKVRILFDGKQKVSHDPKYDNMTMHYEEKLHYRGELPFTYFFCWSSHNLATSFIPFYEYRRYGHRANFPFDFLDTKLNLYGASLQLLYLF